MSSGPTSHLSSFVAPPQVRHRLWSHAHPGVNQDQQDAPLRAPPSRDRERHADGGAAAPVTETRLSSGTAQEPRFRIVIPLLNGCALFIEGPDSHVHCVAI